MTDNVADAEDDADDDGDDVAVAAAEPVCDADDVCVADWERVDV